MICTLCNRFLVIAVITSFNGLTFFTWVSTGFFIRMTVPCCELCLLLHDEVGSGDTNVASRPPYSSSFQAATLPYTGRLNISMVIDRVR